MRLFLLRRAFAYRAEPNGAVTKDVMHISQLLPPPPFTKDSLPVKAVPALKAKAGEVVLDVKAAAGKHPFFLLP